MKVRIVSPGWETFTGPLGQNAHFENGESVEDLTLRQVARIGSSLQIIDVATGEQVGPSVIAASMRFNEAPVAEPNLMKVDLDAKAAADALADRERLAKEEEIRKVAEAQALEAAREKAEAEAKLVVYSRQELEAIGANDGIDGLRHIAKPFGVRGRGISELITEILAAQAKLVAE